MNSHLPEEHEMKLSERFDRGERTGRTDVERQILRTYAQIPDALQSLPTLEYDAESVSRGMQQEMRRRAWRITFPSVVTRIPRPVWAAACFVLVVMGFVSANYVIHTPYPVNEALFMSETNPHPVSWLWRFRLERGYFVQVPRGVSAEIHLPDRSIVTCSPKTQIAVQFDTDRHITLHSGTITVHAAAVPGSPMMVETPLGTIEVIGTVFHVKVIR